MRILLSAQYPGIPNNHKPIVNEYQIVNGNSYYVTPFEMLAINTQGVRREQCTETAALTHELHPQQKAGVLNPHIKLTFQFRAFQALNSTQERTVSELMLKPKQTNPLQYCQGSPSYSKIQNISVFYEKIQVKVRWEIKLSFCMHTFSHSYEEKLGNTLNENPEWPFKNLNVLFLMHTYCQHQDLGEPLSICYYIAI